MLYGDFLTTCQSILDGFLTFGSKAITWFFTPKEILLGFLGTISITPFNLLLDTFFALIFTRIALSINK